MELHFILLQTIVFLIVFVVLINKYFEKLIYNLVLIGTIFIFFLSILLWFFHAKKIMPEPISIGDKVLRFFYFLLQDEGLMSFVPFSYDPLSRIFILLTGFIMPICVLAAYNVPNKKNFLLALLVIELLLMITFTTKQLILFYVCFEAILIPMFYLIINWGSRSRKIKAAFYLFMYTAFGSIFFFMAIALLFSESAVLLHWKGFKSYLKISQFSTIFYFIVFPFSKQLLIWLGFFITFAIKIPIFPFHIWLPEAHVEAPTVGSVILASLLLKIGGYGMIRYVSAFEKISLFMQPFIYLICLVSIIYSSLIAFRQLDIKKIIAYSSIAHMNFVVLSIFTLSFDGIYGAIVLMIGHGIVSGALFLLIGVIYERYHSRNLLYYGGLTQVMPITSLLFFFFSISNFSFPGTANFVGEILILKSIMQINFFVAILLLISSVFTVGYSMFLYNRIFFGNLKYSYIESFSDLTRLEFYCFVPLIIVNFFLGIHPNIFFPHSKNFVILTVNYFFL